MTQGPFDPKTDRARELGRDLAQGWERSEFEAAVSLYVGGDLDAVEASAVEAWLALHPEDRAALDAARAARDAFVAGGDRSTAAGVDLWPSIRTHLVNEGWIGAPTAPAGASVGTRGGAQVPAGTSVGPRMIRSTPRLQLASAAAAALLFVGGLGWALGLGSAAANGGSTARADADSVAVTTELRRSAMREHGERRAGSDRQRSSGGAADANGIFVSSSSGGGVSRLAPVEDGTPHLLDSAVPLDLGAFGPVLHANDPHLGYSDAHSLASDGLGTPTTPLRIQVGEGRFLYFEVGGR